MILPLLGSKSMINFATIEGTRNIICRNMKVKPDEAVLVVSDSTRLQLAEGIAYALLEINSRYHEAHNELAMSVMKPRKTSGEEPPKSIAAAMRASDVVLITCMHVEGRRFYV